MIAVTPHPLPYLNALLPKDQDLLAQEEEAQPTPSGKSSKSSQGGAKDGETNEQEGDPTDPEAIDNPYLRPVKMARYRKKGGGGNWGLELLCSFKELNKWLFLGRKLCMWSAENKGFEWKSVTKTAELFLLLQSEMVVWGSCSKWNWDIRLQCLGGQISAVHSELEVLKLVKMYVN